MERLDRIKQRMGLVVLNAVMAALAGIVVGFAAHADPVPVGADPMPAPSGGPVSLFPDMPQIGSPSWLNDNIGRVWFSYRGDHRKRDQMPEYNLNENGFISGSDLLTASALLDPFRFMLSQPGGTQPAPAPSGAPSIADRYKTYVQEAISGQGMATAVMSRILDNQAMQHLLPPHVSDERVQYVMDAVMSEVAILYGKAKRGDAVIGMFTSDELFSILQDYVRCLGDKDVTLKIDWKKQDNGLNEEFRELSQPGEFKNWQPLQIVFQKLPATLDAFREGVRAQLESQYRAMLRAATWSILVQEREQQAGLAAPYSVTKADLAKFYDALKDQFRIDTTDIQVSEYEISGPQTPSFRARMETLLQQRYDDMMAQLQAMLGGKSPYDLKPEEVAAMKEKERSLRVSIPWDVFKQLSAEFAQARADGSLSIEFRDRTFHRTSVDPAPQGNSVDSQELMAVSNALWVQSSLAPRLELNENAWQAPDADHPIACVPSPTPSASPVPAPSASPAVSAAAPDQLAPTTHLRVMFYGDATQSPPAMLPVTDPRVHDRIVQLIQERVQGLAYRDLAANLFNENRFEKMTDTCSDTVSGPWPCLPYAGQDASIHWAETLFPEVLFAGESLPSSGPGQPAIKSTIFRPELYGKVMTIPLDQFQRVLVEPNQPPELHPAR